MSSKPTGYSPGHRQRWQERKSRRVPAAFSFCFDRLTACALEPLASAATIYARRATPVAIAVHAALKAVLPPMPAAEAAPHMGQDGEPAFLAIVQGLVERVSRIGDPLHRRLRGRHAVGAVAQARDRIVRLLLVL